MNPELHSLLKRQLKRHFPDGKPPADLAGFIEVVNIAYKEFDQDRTLLERSLDFSSQELFQANTDMRENTARLKSIYEASPVGIYFTDEKGGCLYANSMLLKITGLSEREILGDGWTTALHPEDAARVIEERGRAVKERSSFENVYRFQHKDGTVVWAKEKGVPIKGVDGVHAHVGSIEDVTLQKRFEGQLLQAQKMETVGTLAGGIAHDLNNQLTPLRGYIDLLLGQASPSHPDYSFLQEIDQASVRCAEIVQRLVNFSRPSTQQKERLGLRNIFTELKTLYAKFLPATIAVEIRYSDDLWAVSGNDNELQTVFMNLATNARDAMPAGGTLSIYAENLRLDEPELGLEKGPYVLVTVQDSGSGMPQEIQNRIFEPFFTTKRGAGGTGLGLPMVFKIIQDHKGRVNVQSAMGKGTTFKIYLPASDSPTSVCVLQTVPLPPKGTGTILVADDEAPIRALAKTFLEKLGYTILLAEDALECLETYRTHRSEIAAVLMDMTMPKLSGRETLKKLLEIDPKAKIIIASGYTSEGTAKDLLAHGAIDFIQKPYTILPLAQSLHKALPTQSPPNP